MNQMLEIDENKWKCSDIQQYTTGCLATINGAKQSRERDTPKTHQWLQTCSCLQLKIVPNIVLCWLGFAFLLLKLKCLFTIGHVLEFLESTERPHDCPIIQPPKLCDYANIIVIKGPGLGSDHWADVIVLLLFQAWPTFLWLIPVFVSLLYACLCVTQQR